MLLLEALAIPATVIGLSLWFSRVPRTPEQRYIDQLARRDRHA